MVRSDPLWNAKKNPLTRTCPFPTPTQPSQLPPVLNHQPEVPSGQEEEDTVEEAMPCPPRECRSVICVRAPTYWHDVCTDPKQSRQAHVLLVAAPTIRRTTIRGYRQPGGHSTLKSPAIAAEEQDTQKSNALTSTQEPRRQLPYPGLLTGV